MFPNHQFTNHFTASNEYKQESKKLFESQNIATIPRILQNRVDNLNKTIKRNYSFTSFLHSARITFIIGKNEFQCIRPLFAIHSHILKQIMYQHHMDMVPFQEDINLNNIGLNAIEYNSFKIIQKWCYNIDTDIHLHSIIDILCWSNVFLDFNLTHLCHEYINKMFEKGGKLWQKQCIFLLSQIEQKNAFKFIPFETFSTLVLKNHIFTSGTSLEERWILCMKFSENKFHPKLEYFMNGYIEQKNNDSNINTSYDITFLKKCIAQFNLDKFNINFLMNHIIAHNILNNKDTIQILSKHVNTIINIASKDASQGCNYSTHSNNFNSNNASTAKLCHALKEFQPYHFSYELIKQVNNPQYFQWLSKSDKYRTTLSNIIRLSVFPKYFTEYHLKKSNELIANTYMNDVIFEIEYDEKNDHRKTLVSIENNNENDNFDNDESNLKYAVIFALFALQSDKFNDMNKQHFPLHSTIKLKNIKPSTFRFLRDYFYGKTDLKITPYNVLDLYCVCKQYKLDIICNGCLELFANLNLYKLPTDKLFQILLCIDSFAAIYNPPIPFISKIFEICPRFVLKRDFTADQTMEILNYKDIFKLSLFGFEDFIFNTHKFLKHSCEEDLFVLCVRFAKRSGNGIDTKIMKTVLERLIISKHFEFGDHLNIDQVIKMIMSTELDDYNEAKMILKIYQVSQEKYHELRERQRVKEEQREQEIRQEEERLKLEREWTKCNFNIYDELVGVIVNENGTQIECWKQKELRAQYLLCLSDRGYENGIHILKYRIECTDSYLAIGISTICNKMIRKGYGLYHLLGRSKEKQGEILGGKFICVWADGTLLKYIDGENVIKQMNKNDVWKIGDVICVCFDLYEWCVEFRKNGNVIGSKVKLDENVMYYPIVQLHTKSNHKIVLFEQLHDKVVNKQRH